MKLTKQQKERNEKLAKDLIKFIQDRGCWEDICVFFNGKALSSNKNWNVWKGVLIEETINEFTEEVNKVYEYTDIESPKHWTEYANEKSVTIIFDGVFYDWIHYYSGSWDKLQTLLDKYNAYFEIGHTTDLSIYFN